MRIHLYLDLEAAQVRGPPFNAQVPFLPFLSNTIVLDEQPLLFFFCSWRGEHFDFVAFAFFFDACHQGAATSIRGRHGRHGVGFAQA
jgi:hypothetical protein